MPVDDPVPVVLPGEVPVVVPGDVVWLELVELGVVDVPSVGAPVELADVVPLEVEDDVDDDVDVDVDVDVDDDADVPVDDFDVPSVGFAVLLSFGALMLAPPPLITVEMPPLECSSTFVETVVMDVEVSAGVFDDVGVELDPSGTSGMIGDSSTLDGPVDAADPSWPELGLAGMVGAG